MKKAEGREVRREVERASMLEALDALETHASNHHARSEEEEEERTVGYGWSRAGYEFEPSCQGPRRG
eukprot:6181045-Prymnesium_polylepis.2